MNPLRLKQYCGVERAQVRKAVVWLGHVLHSSCPGVFVRENITVTTERDPPPVDHLLCRIVKSVMLSASEAFDFVEHPHHLAHTLTPPLKRRIL